MSRRKVDVTDSSLFVQNDMNILVDWDSTRIAQVLMSETDVGEENAKSIAEEVSNVIKASGLKTVTSSLVREIVDSKLIERGFEDEVVKHQLIGFSPTEVGNIITQKNNENANVPRGPEATNLVIAEAVKKRYYLNSVLDKDVAEAHMRGDIHIHDLGMPDRNYCGGNPIQYVAKFGLDLPTSISSAKPAKNAEVLLEQVVKFSASLQGCFAGAVGWDAVNMAIAPYIVGKSYKEIKQLAQILVFEFAQQAISRGGQAVFSDLNLYWEIPSHYAEVEAIGPGGMGTGKPYKDYLKESQAFVMALFDVLYEGDAKGRPFFFPKANVHITTKMFETEGYDEFLDKICAVASEKGNTYFIIDRGRTARISQCCFDRGQKVLIKRDDGIALVPIEDVRKRFNAKVYHNGSWVPFKRVETPRGDRGMFKITTTNDKVMIVTEDHVFPTLRGDVSTADLSTDDFLLFSTRVLEGSGMTYEQGVWVGAYLGDGSHRDGGITLSLSEDKLSLLESPLIQGLKDWNITSELRTYEPRNNSITANVYSKRFDEIISEFVSGNKSHEKRLTMNVLKYSTEFRKGIIDGLYATDGGNSNRIYTTSRGLVEDIECLFTSLGKVTNVDVSDRTDEPVIIRGDTYTRNFPLYCIRWYDDGVYRQKENLYKMRNNSLFFKIRSICPVLNYDDDTVFCFDMENEDEPYFTLPNGIITHNCRLTFDLSNDDLEEAKEPWRVRHSAIQNVTINMPRCAIDAKGDYDRFCENIERNMRLAMKAHITKRDYLRSLLDMGEDGPLAVLTMNHDGEPYFRLDRGKALIGVVGLSEVVKVLTGEEFGESPASSKYGLKVLSFMNQKCKEFTEEFGIHTILEQTPAETTAYRFAKMDREKYPAYESLFKGDHETGGVYYTNSSYIPVESDVSPIERIKIEGKTHPLISAGSITHIWVGENKPTSDSVKALVLKVFENSSCSQFDITPEFTTCLDCDKTTRGLASKCPYCGSEHVEGITRVTGYMSKIKQWNKGKVAELKDRSRHSLA